MMGGDWEEKGMDESIIYLSPRPKAKLGYTVSQKRPNFEMV